MFRSRDGRTRQNDHSVDGQAKISWHRCVCGTTADDSKQRAAAEWHRAAAGVPPGTTGDQWNPATPPTGRNDSADTGHTAWILQPPLHQPGERPVQQLVNSCHGHTTLRPDIAQSFIQGPSDERTKPEILLRRVGGVKMRAVRR